MVKRHKKKSFILLLLLTFLFVAAYILNNYNSTHENKSLTSLNEKNIKYNLEEKTSDFNVYFCQTDNCLKPVYNLFSNAKSQIKCAFYDLDSVNLTEELVDKTKENVKVSIIVDNDYLDEWALRIFENTNVDLFSDKNRNTKYNNYMHDKFCIVDGKYVLTGSMNPTDKGITRNDNNLVIFESEYIAKNYENEFNQLRLGNFGYNKHSTLEYNNITLITNQLSPITISSFMCPQDECDVKLVNELSKAKSEIIFATFELSHDGIKNKLITLHNNAINISGIIEKRNYNIQGSDVRELTHYFKIYNDTNPANMHHKFWIIDGKTVITGSMNPSFNGVNYNDENILVIHNEEIAKQFKEEYLRMIN